MSRNVLFILSDQHRADAVGCYGNSIVHTPNLDRLAGRGVRFDAAYCQSPLCAPSRGSLLTGTHCHTCGLYTQKTPPNRELPTLGTLFRDAGFATGAFGKMHIPGEDDAHDLGFTERGLRCCTKKVHHYSEVLPPERAKKYRAGGVGEWDMKHYNPWNRPIELNEDEVLDTLVTDRSIRFMEEHQGEPFCLYVGLEKPHPDWYAPARYHAMYRPGDILLPPDFDRAAADVPASMMKRQEYLESHRHSPDEVRGCIAAYYANVSYIDDQIGRLLNALERLGLDETTTIVYTSDHGELLFDGGWLQKHCFLEAAVRVPMIMAGPELPRGKGCDEIVSLMDLLPTLVELHGLGRPDSLEGESLTSVIRGEMGNREGAAYSEYYWTSPPARMIRTHRWKYIHTEGEIPQLYDMMNDPREHVNLAGDPAYRALCRELERRVLSGWEIPRLDVESTAIKSRYRDKEEWLRKRKEGQ